MLNASTLKNCISMSHYLKRQEALIPAAPRSLLRDTGVGACNPASTQGGDFHMMYETQYCLEREKKQERKRANLI